jgi:hypothetical protein
MGHDHSHHQPDHHGLLMKGIMRRLRYRPYPARVKRVREGDGGVPSRE